jgi:alcohol dehydrogenase (cytochrome c)
MQTAQSHMKKKILIIIGVLIVIGAAAGRGLYVAFPVQLSTIAGLSRDFLLTLNSPPGTVSTETNSAYQAPSGSAPVPAVDAAESGTDWPSYNRTVTSRRFSQLDQINTKNVGKLKVLCSYDTGSFAAFESGLIMVNNALIGTTEFDIFSLDPATCALNWRTHEDYPPSLLPSNRGAAYMDGLLFRGTQDGRVLGYDFKTGKRLWATTIANAKMGESVPAAPIAYDGLVYIGNSGGDFKGGQGHVYALEPKTGKIVWEFYLAPRSEDDAPRGPVGASPSIVATWKNAPGIPISGGGTWTSTTLDTKNGLLYVPGGNPAPDFVQGGLDGPTGRGGPNLYTGSVVVLDAKTGDYKNHFKIVPHDWHDWDVSNPPILIQTMGGKQLMAVAPKDGHLYGYNLVDNSLIYRVPMTTMLNTEVAFEPGKSVHFCPGPVGGDEWNSPAYVPDTNLILVGEVDWCYAVTVQDDKQLSAVAMGQPWAGMASLNPFNVFGAAHRIADNGWSGWLNAVDADSGIWKWRARSNYPVVSGITPTAGGIVFFGDMGGNFYALDAATGQKLFAQALGGAIAGGVITYTVNDTQKVAVAYGFSMLAWPVKVVTAKVAIMGVDAAASP